MNHTNFVVNLLPIRRVRVVTVVCIIAAVLLGLAPRLVHAAALNEFLDFNDEQIPAGWSLVLENVGLNVTFSNQRFEVGQVDTTATLLKDIQLSDDTTSIIYSYTANAADNFWGMGSAIRLYDNAGGYFSIHGPSHGGFGEPGVRMAIGYRPASGPGTDFPLPNGGVFPADWGTYQVSGTIEDGRVTLSATKENAPTPIFNGTILVPTLQLNQINKIGISEFVTSGESGWIDDVSIQSTVPEPSSLGTLALIAMSFQSRRRRLVSKKIQNS